MEFLVIGFVGWLATVLVICKRQKGGAAFGLIILSLFLWPLALIISLCCSNKPAVQVIYNVTSDRLPADLRQ